MATFETESVLGTKVATLRSLFSTVQILKKILCQYFKIPVLDPNQAEIKIQRWYRKIRSQKINLEKSRKAVQKIEAWWIGTLLRRKIKDAVIRNVIHILNL